MAMVMETSPGILNSGLPSPLKDHWGGSGEAMEGDSWDVARQSSWEIEDTTNMEAM